MRQRRLRRRTKARTSIPRTLALVMSAVRNVWESVPSAFPGVTCDITSYPTGVVSIPCSNVGISDDQTKESEEKRVEDLASDASWNKEDKSEVQPGVASLCF